MFLTTQIDYWINWNEFLLGSQILPYGSPVWSGKHSQIPLWLTGVHSAFRAQSQGSTHFSLRQVNVVAQSGSVRHSYCLQRSYGFPLCPGKHVHLGLWFLTEHSALTPHCSNKQGFWHSLLIQACVWGHSESLLQPAKIFLWKKNTKMKKTGNNGTVKRFGEPKTTNISMDLTFFTNGERITDKSIKANTESSVVSNHTFGIDTTGVALAWILTFFTDTCKVGGTFIVRRAFRSWCWNNMIQHSSCKNGKIGASYM